MRHIPAAPENPETAMSTFLNALDQQALLTDGAMGSYLFELTGRLSEPNHVYESFNADQPALVAQVHAAYLAAGAQCLKTNTFAANRVQLEPCGLASRVAELNQAGVRVARQAIAEFQARRGSAEPVFVLGSIGPTQPVLTEAAAVESAYGEQVDSLAAAGVDAFLLETFDSVAQLELLAGLIRRRPGAPPVIAAMTVRSPGSGPRTEPREFIGRMAALGVPVAGVNCCAPWDATAFVDAVQETEPVRTGALRLVVLPNAGGFQRIGSRFMTSVNPEYAGKLARSYFDRGVRLIGGCCEMHPPHIREMHNYLHARRAAAPAVAAVSVASAHPPCGADEKRGNGPFSRKLKAGEFVVSVEILPPRGTDPKAHQGKVDFVRRLAASGLTDAIDITDGSRGIPLMAPGDFAHLLRAGLGWPAGGGGDGLEFIPHFTGRDLNTMGVQSRLVGYHSAGLRNVLFITGDPPKMSPTYPRATAVFDLDSVAMIRLTHTCLNAGVDFGGAALGKQADPRTRFTIGTGFECEAMDPARERRRLEEKLDAGVDYVMTQPAFRFEPLSVLEPYRARCPILVGVMILASFEQARRMAQVPGVSLPDALLQRLGAMADPADQAKVGREIAAEQIREVVRAGWPGVYLMSPGSSAGVLEVLRDGLGR